MFDTQSSVERRKMLAHKISINGETVDFEHEQINIHDFAEFEKTEQLIPEFRFSIKSKSSAPLLRQENLSVDAGDECVFEEAPPKKTKSFQDIARQVYLMENALARWPKRPRSRHHSSSSEDLVEDDEEDTCNKVDADDISVHTDVSELSQEDDETKPANVTVINTNSNSQGADESALRKRSSARSSLTIGNENEGMEKKDTTKQRNISMHDEVFDLHGHDNSKLKDSSVKDNQEKDYKGRQQRCPNCVVL